MNEQQVERLAASPAPRVTREQIDKRIVDITYTVLSGGRITTCQIHLDNGFVVFGYSICASAENFDKALGEDLAYEDAHRQLWPLIGLLMAESAFHKRAIATAAQRQSGA